MHPALRVLLSSLLLAASAVASDISWSCAINSTNRTSAGAPNVIGAGFVFELGGFVDGFVPTSANTAEWAGKWAALDRAEYNPVNRFFTKKATVDSNAAPFTWGGQGYIWGFDGASPGEWILLKNSTWLWPGAGGAPQPPQQWSVGHASTVAVLGNVHGEDFLMQTALVFEEPPDVSPTAWKHQFFNAAERNNPTISGWDADADNDGANNLLELAAGTNPRITSQSPSVEVGLVDLGSGTHAVQIRLGRQHRAAITHGASFSTDLSNWSSTGMAVESDTLEELVLSFPADLPRQFVRFTFGI